ncbi:hypothetical protein [Kribbella sp. NPDC048928]|uniref:hypothetical protein n=1 Tax=Kribbella sp. NPDC048928 TaxID=3364111 RepID=UPI003717183D
MPISLVLRRESGEDIRRASAAYVPADASRDDQLYPLLNGVDPYSNTIFNTRQMRRLRLEAERLLDGPLSDDERESLEQVVEFCREGNRVHRFLWFVGD